MPPSAELGIALDYHATLWEGDPEDAALCRRISADLLALEDRWRESVVALDAWQQDHPTGRHSVRPVVANP